MRPHPRTRSNAAGLGLALPQPRPVLLELQGDSDYAWNMSFSGFREAVRLTAPKDVTPALMVTPNNTVT